MTHVHAAADGERLPWLNDDLPARGGGLNALLGWGLGAITLVGALSFWAGMNAPLPSWPASSDSQPEATVKLPEAAPADPIVEDPPAMPQVEPVVAPPPVVPPRVEQVRQARPVPKRKIRTATVTDDELKAVVKKQSAAAAKVAEPAKPKSPLLYDSWESAGASGRMVRIGTYRSRDQAKKAWSRLVKVYPGMRRLRAVTTDIPSLRNGRTYYRLQFGTSSQAHSEVLCQRMRTIGQSCVVVDLAGARARNEDVGQPVGL